ncbi:hypothetical protein ACLKA7_014552 [Drosophila subpalustris]
MFAPVAVDGFLLDLEFCFSGSVYGFGQHSISVSVFASIYDFGYPASSRLQIADCSCTKWISERVQRATVLETCVQL